MGRTLSSSLTFIYRFVAPGFCACAVASLLLSGDPGNWPGKWFLICGLPVSLFLTQVKHVRMDDMALYISDYNGKITVPLGDVAKVTELLPLGPDGPVILKFRSPTKFGSWIFFMPKLSWLLSQPVVDELRSAVANAAESRGHLPLLPAVELLWFRGRSMIGSEEATMPESLVPYPLELRRQMVDLVPPGREPEQLTLFERRAQSMQIEDEPSAPSTLMQELRDRTDPYDKTGYKLLIYYGALVVGLGYIAIEYRLSTASAAKWAQWLPALVLLLGSLVCSHQQDESEAHRLRLLSYRRKKQREIAWLEQIWLGGGYSANSSSGEAITPEFAEGKQLLQGEVDAVAKEIAEEIKVAGRFYRWRNWLLLGALAELVAGRLFL